MQTSKLDWVANEDGSRWFLVLRIAPESDVGQRLSKILVACNRAVTMHGQPPLYAARLGSNMQANDGSNHIRQSHPFTNRQRGNASHQAGQSHLDRHKFAAPTKDEPTSFGFHVSVAWSLSRPDEPPSMATADLHERFRAEIKPMTVGISRIKVKIGNVVTSIPLHDRREDPQGLIGI